MGTKDGFNFSDLLCAGLRVLDAGCGFGMATFALLRALRQMNLGYHRIDAFDLTPAVLSHFREEIESARRMCWSWRPCRFMDRLRSNPVAIHAGIPAERAIAFALARLRARLAVGGLLLAMITRKTPETKLFIDWGWRAERYRKEELAEAFRIDLQWLRFPWRYFWLNRANYIVVARCRNPGSLESDR